MKTILVTGATDGIGRLATEKFAKLGHQILAHGRDQKKLESLTNNTIGKIEPYQADLSNLSDVRTMCRQLLKQHKRLDAIVNNAGVLKAPNTQTRTNRDIRFEVNTIAPYLITRELLPIIEPKGVIVNVSSAAQAPVDIEALKQFKTMGDMDAYAQSKLAITAWSRYLAQTLTDGPSVVSVNPGSLLATKMVKDGFGIEGKDLNIGADVLVRLVTDPVASKRTGEYFDNDLGDFGRPHSDVFDDSFSRRLITSLDTIINETSTK
jgi:NAD(P)-dependent dehydrogenase (short-subunit alcohol dehydrogenase family)